MEEIVSFIKTRNKNNGDSVMFDIDDTLINQKTGKIIKHIKKLLDLCISRGYKVAIITARPPFEDNVMWTERQLMYHSIRYNFLAFCSPQDKTHCKKHLIEKEGWNFVLSVGDQPTDLTDSDMYLLVT